MRARLITVSVLRKNWMYRDRRQLKKKLHTGITPAVETLGKGI
jgi:hypothetical protein